MSPKPTPEVTRNDSTQTAETRPYRALELDVEMYDALLDSPELSADQRREFIETLWSIMVAFVDLGFDIRPASESCGQLVEAETPPPLPEHDRLSLKDRFTVQNAAGARELHAAGSVKGGQS